MSGERLTLAGAFGVDLSALGRRLADRQAELNRDDAACAQLAGVSAERWRGWKEGTEVPGVARVPAMSAALDAPASWVLYGTTAHNAPLVETVERSTEQTRKVLDVLNRLAPAVEVVETLAEEIARLKLPIPGGAVMGVSLVNAGEQIRVHDAVTLSTTSPG